MIYVPKRNRISFNNILSIMMTIIMILKIVRGSNDDENSSDILLSIKYNLVNQFSKCRREGRSTRRQKYKETSFSSISTIIMNSVENG